ncbi:hypothetical protein As57867_000781, partial [Aphanomyces stellatus]
KLSKWKTLYGPIAKAHGFLPEGSFQTEQLNVNDHTDDELDRFHNTVLNVQEAAKNNPQATFSEFNQFALLTQDEFKRAVMASYGAHNTTQAKPLVAALDPKSVASNMDWSTHKCNPPVVSQGQCGSCWAFSTVGTVEIAHCLGSGELLDLSQQQVVSCDKHNLGCNGGYPAAAIDFMQDGVCLASDYPYTSGDDGYTGSCKTSCTKKALALGDTIQTSGEASLTKVLNKQPATVIVESGNPVWQNYKSGVVTQCPGYGSDHAVIAIGYGTSKDGIDFFKIKNSWGAQWGDNGYIYLQRGSSRPDRGMCNVAEAISYPEVNDTPPRPLTTLPPSPPSGNEMQDQLTDQTNNIRAAHGLKPLKWNSTVASDLQRWASSCPGNQFGGVQGWQNLVGFQPCDGHCRKVVGAAWSFYSRQETLWNYDSNQCRDGNWANCAFFSNSMSPAATSFGCGWSQCANGNYVWCNYLTPDDKSVIPRIQNGIAKYQLKASLIA